MTFAERIERAAGKEEILSCVIGAFAGEDPPYEKDYEPVDVGNKRYRWLSWKQARPFLDYEYTPSYGISLCHAIYAWTPSRTLFAVEFDGMVDIASVPRSSFGGSRPRLVSHGEFGP